MNTLVNYAAFTGGRFRGEMMGERSYVYFHFGGYIILLLLVVAAYFIFKHVINKKGADKSYDQSLLILNSRLAEGEITEDDYKAKKALLINDEKKIKEKAITKEPMEVLNTRFAKGEINEEEYKSKKELLLKK